MVPGCVFRMMESPIHGCRCCRVTPPLKITVTWPKSYTCALSEVKRYIGPTTFLPQRQFPAVKPVRPGLPRRRYFHNLPGCAAETRMVIGDFLRSAWFHRVAHWAHWSKKQPMILWSRLSYSTNFKVKKIRFLHPALPVVDGWKGFATQMLFCTWLISIWNYVIWWYASLCTALRFYNTSAHLSEKEGNKNRRTLVCQFSPMNLRKLPCELCPISAEQTSRDEGGRGRR